MGQNRDWEMRQKEVGARGGGEAEGERGAKEGRGKASFRVCNQFYSSAFTLSIFTPLCQRPHLIDNQGNHRVINAQQTGA